ncbi:MAG TPA: zinc-dependent metalloprotease [Actinomycetota bacterium]|nr:zinc-dependent metalloprotease [Actinomycetota bacterium]
MAQSPFGDIPLFRELQRLLSANEGPINYEIARQVAISVVVDESGWAPDQKDARAFEDAVREAEVLVAGFTRLRAAEPAQTVLLSRRTWIDSTMTAWAWVLEHLARRLGGELADAPEESGPEAPLGAAIKQMAPLLVGIQTGQLLGNLANRMLGRYDIPIPRDDDGRLLFVVPNITEVMRDYNLGDGFIRWLAAREVTPHLIVAAVPWMERYWRNLIIEVVDSIELDVSDLERRLMELQSGGLDPNSLAQPGEALPFASTDRHRRAQNNLRAFETLVAGYAAHASIAVSPTLVGEDAPRFAEAMTRYRATGDEAESMLSQLLGLVLDRSAQISGATFCAAVAQLKGIDSLNQVWAAPDNVPTLEEIVDPFVWMDRVLDA